MGLATWKGRNFRHLIFRVAMRSSTGDSDCWCVGWLRFWQPIFFKWKRVWSSSIHCSGLFRRAGFFPCYYPAVCQYPLCRQMWGPFCFLSFWIAKGGRASRKAYLLAKQVRDTNNMARALIQMAVILRALTNLRSILQDGTNVSQCCCGGTVPHNLTSSAATRTRLQYHKTTDVVPSHWGLFTTHTKNPECSLCLRGYGAASSFYNRPEFRRSTPTLSRSCWPRYMNLLVKFLLYSGCGLAAEDHEAQSLCAESAKVLMRRT